jgi:hypothetical protein
VTTFGLRYWNGYFHFHVMWMSLTPPYGWNSSRMRNRYRDLDKALRHIDTKDTVVIIFPV